MVLSSVLDRGWSLSEWRKRLPLKTPDQVLIVFSIVSILAFTLLVPLGGILYYSLGPTYPVTESWYFTTEHYERLFGNSELLINITVDTLIYGIGTTILSMTIGITAAIFEVKYFDDSPFRLLMLLPYGLPVVASLTGWIILLGDNGVITNIVMDAFNLSESPYNLYSMGGMIFVEAIHTAPIAFILVSPALKSIPAAIDEAGLTGGLSRLTVYRKIILPLVMPAIISIAIYLFARSLTTVVTPGILGIPERIFTWGSAIPFLFLSGRSLNYSLALAFSVFMTVATGIMMIYYYYATAKASKYSTVTGKGGGDRKIYQTTKWRKWGMGAFFVTYLIIAGFLPLLTVVWNSLLPTFQFTLDPTILTTQYYEQLLAGQTQEGTSLPFFRGLRNTIIVGIVVPSIAMIVAFLVSYSNRSLDMPFSGFISYLASAPLAIPSLTIGLGFLIVYLRTPLYGTVFVLILAFIAKAIPTGMRYSSPAVTKIGKGNVEAASISGFGEIRTFRKVILPLTIDDFIAGWMHTFVSAVRNVAIPILLYSTGSEVIAIVLVNSLRAARYKTASAIAVVITILAMVPYMFLQYWRTKRDVRR